MISAAMTSDPGAWIIFAGLLGAAIGFFAAALMASSTIRRTRRAEWREGYAACNRDKERERAR